MKSKNSKSKFLTLMICASFASCGRVPLSGVRLILEPEPEIYSITKNVVGCINEAAGTEVVVLGVGVNATRVMWLNDGDQWVCGSWREGQDEPDVIYIDPDPGDCPTGIVLVHEIGHAMGLWHNLLDQEDIMYPSVTFLNMTQACHSLLSHFSAE